MLKLITLYQGQYYHIIIVIRQEFRVNNITTFD